MIIDKSEKGKLIVEVSEKREWNLFIRVVISKYMEKEKRNLVLRFGGRELVVSNPNEVYGLEL